MHKISLSTIALSLISIIMFVFTVSSSSIGMIQPVVIEKEKIVFKSNLKPELPPKEQMICLAQNVYFEAITESFAGQLAVIAVTLNRVTDDRYPDTICGVVWQGNYNNPKLVRRNSCQFSWTCDGKPDVIRDKKAWSKAMEVAEVGIKMYNDGYDITEGSTHYHATYVLPKWHRDRNMERIGKVDQHIFYRWDNIQ